MECARPRTTTGPHAASSAALPKTATWLRPLESAADQEEISTVIEQVIPPLRPEGAGDLLRPADGDRLPAPPAMAGTLVRQGRHHRPGRQGEDGRHPEQGSRSTSSSYLDGHHHQGEKYNKVVDVLVELQRKVAEEMMKGDPAPPTWASRSTSVWMRSDSRRQRLGAPIKQLASCGGLSQALGVAHRDADNIELTEGLTSSSTSTRRTAPVGSRRDTP